jgi:short-subunit dehydrogenase
VYFRNEAEQITFRKLGQKNQNSTEILSLNIMTTKEHFLNWENPGKAFITGASSGIGLSFANQLARQGFNLILLARRKERLESIASKLESENFIRCEIIQADLSDTGDIKKTAEYIQKIDDLDVLVNNAGFATLGYFTDVPVEKSLGMMNVHLTATVQFSHAAIGGMLNRKRGAIINVSSIGSFVLSPGNVVYDATKSFLNTFSENLMLEMNGADIRIQALCPGFTRTEFHEVGDFRNYDRNDIPDSMWMSPNEVASLSLKSLGKNKKIVYIPGWKKRLSKWIIMHCSLVRKALVDKANKDLLKENQRTQNDDNRELQYNFRRK